MCVCVTRLLWFAEGRQLGEGEVETAVFASANGIQNKPGLPDLFGQRFFRLGGVKTH